MKLGHNFTKFFSIPLTIFVWFPLSIYPLAVLSTEAESNNKTESNQNSEGRFDGTGNPDNQGDAGNRSASCQHIVNNTINSFNVSIIPLMPHNNKSYFITTSQSNPSWWFLVTIEADEGSFLPDTLPTVGFNIIIQNDKREDLVNIPSSTLDSEFTLVQVPVALNEELDPTLEYKWYFQVECNENNPELGPSVEGSIQKILETDNSFDRIDSLTQAVCRDRDNEIVLAEWKKVLTEAAVNPNEVLSQSFSCQSLLDNG